MVEKEGVHMQNRRLAPEDSSYWLRLSLLVTIDYWLPVGIRVDNGTAMQLEVLESEPLVTSSCLQVAIS